MVLGYFSLTPSCHRSNKRYIYNFCKFHKNEKSSHFYRLHSDLDLGENQRHSVTDGGTQTESGGPHHHLAASHHDTEPAKHGGSHPHHQEGDHGEGPTTDRGYQAAEKGGQELVQAAPPTAEAGVGAVLPAAVVTVGPVRLGEHVLKFYLQSGSFMMYCGNI